MSNSSSCDYPESVVFESSANPSLVMVRYLTATIKNGDFNYYYFTPGLKWHVQ